MRTRSLLLLLLLFACSRTLLTAQLASLLKDIRTVADGGSSYPQFLGSVGGWTYFSADTSTVGRGLWKTDGTPEGTDLVRDECPDYCSTYYSTLQSTDEHLFLARSPYPSPGAANALLVATGTPPQVTAILTGGGGVSISNLDLPDATALVQDRLIFWAAEPTGGAQLLSTDATATGYGTLHTFPGSNGLFGLRAVGSNAYFWNRPIATPAELWATDGTESGTRLIRVLEVEPQEQSIALGGHLLVFTARGENGLEAWSTDGTWEGTRRITELADPDARIWGMDTSATTAFFYVEDITFGQEIWATDGSPTGTHAITAFGNHAPFGTDIYASHFAIAGSHVYFLATDGISSAKLWSADATPGSESVIVDICPDAYCTYESWIESIGTQLFFTREEFDTGREVWTSDGTPSGTHILEDACPGPCLGHGTLLSSSGGKLVYAASPTGSYEATVYVVTAPWLESQSLFDAARGAPSLDPYQETSCIVDGSKIYFGARDSLAGLEPWVSQGAPSNSFVLADISGAVNNSSAPRGFATTNGTVAFLADGNSYNLRYWLTDGTAGSTRPATSDDYLCINWYSTLQPLGMRFAGIGCFGGIWVIDPASNQVEPIATGDCYAEFSSASIGGTLVTVFGCGDTTQIWRSDGTSQGTTSALTLPPGFSVGSALERVGSTLLLSGGQSSYRLYAFSSSMSNLTPITALGVYPYSRILPAGETLGFFSYDRQLWRTDGTAIGTYAIRVADSELRLQAATRSANGYDLVVLKDSYLEEILSSDGTAQGTVVRATIPVPSGSSYVLALERAEQFVYFILPFYQGETSLWVLQDGSSTPLRLHSASPSTVDLGDGALAHLGSRLLFPACDANHGCELWTSDGTIEGTRLLQDIAPGAYSSNPSHLFAVGPLLYFVADDNFHGYELWTLPLEGGPACQPDGQALCLESGRFQVTSTWRDFAGNSGDATAVPISGDTGYFWFFDDANVEMILKLIDGTGYNEHHWVYYGALSNVEYTFTVTDSVTGAAKRYFNPATRFASSGDIQAFGPQGAHASGGPAEAVTRAATPPVVSLAALSAPQGLPGACVPSTTRFCILNNRFAVEATWRDFAGRTGTANADTLTDDTGYLWFFDDANVEVVLKMIDGSGFNNRFWVYYGALSNVEYTLTVTDTVAGGPARIYHNALGQFGSFGDIEAFPAP